jgi:hypothetical protein
MYSETSVSLATQMLLGDTDDMSGLRSQCAMPRKVSGPTICLCVARNAKFVIIQFHSHVKVTKMELVVRK